MVTQIIRRQPTGERAHVQEQGRDARPTAAAAVPAPAPEPVPDLDNVTLAQAAAAANAAKKLRASRTRTHAAGRAAAGIAPSTGGTPLPGTTEVAAAPEGLDLIIGRRIGPFRFTPKQSFQKSGGKHGGWEVFCPFHAKNYKSGRRKWFPIFGPDLRDKRVAANAALAWCAAASTVNKHCLHLAYPIDYDAAPLAAVTRALPIFHTDAPSTRAIPDSEMMRSGNVVPKAKARSRKRAEAKGHDGTPPPPPPKMPRKGFV